MPRRRRSTACQDGRILAPPGRPGKAFQPLARQAAQCRLPALVRHAARASAVGSRSPRGGHPDRAVNDCMVRLAGLLAPCPQRGAARVARRTVPAARGPALGPDVAPPFVRRRRSSLAELARRGRTIAPLLPHPAQEDSRGAQRRRSAGHHGSGVTSQGSRGPDAGSGTARFYLPAPRLLDSSAPSLGPLAS
jgi:hypothetical protein